MCAIDIVQLVQLRVEWWTGTPILEFAAHAWQTGSGFLLWCWDKLWNTRSADASVLVPILAPVAPVVVAWIGIVRSQRTADRVALANREANRRVAEENQAANRLVAREKATLDLIEKRESTAFYIENLSIFSTIRLAETGFAHLHAPKDENERAQRRSVLNFLNHYELVALGIQKEVLDGDFYREWMGSSFVRDWNAAWDLVWRERWKRPSKDVPWAEEHYNPKPYSRLEAVACDWSEDAIRIREQMRFPPPDDDTGPNDLPLPGLVEDAEPELVTA